jgi:Zn-dependent protease with chaperone function
MSAEVSDVTLAPKPKRVPLKGLRASSFQHPLDRQATENLKVMKGFDWLAAKFVEYGVERIEYVSHVGGGIRVGPRQMSKHYAMLRECCETLDVEEPEMYVMQGGVNAYTSGHNHPFIVIQTGLLGLMDDDEVMAVIAHELGHVKCGHMLYMTMARGIKPLVQMVGAATLGIGTLVGSGIEAALVSWCRRAELSADRAALLTTQDTKPCVSMLMKLAGGTSRHASELDAEQFLNQARAYREGLDSKMSDRFYRFLANMGSTHPFAVERARCLDDWVKTPEYTDIICGNYLRRDLAPAPAGPVCPTCSRPTVPGALFCGECGTPLRPH